MNTRRQFIRRVAGGAALFNILPRALIAGSGQTLPSETVRVASIGAGGRGGAFRPRQAAHVGCVRTPLREQFVR